MGLGNPGKKYENTRHNAGFDVVDELAKRLNVSIDKIKHKALIGEARIGTEKVILVKPQTYMNLSGETALPFFLILNLPISKSISSYTTISLSKSIL